MTSTSWITNGQYTPTTLYVEEEKEGHIKGKDAEAATDSVN